MNGKDYTQTRITNNQKLLIEFAPTNDPSLYISIWPLPLGTKLTAND